MNVFADRRPVRRAASGRGDTCGDGERSVSAEATAIQHNSDVGVTYQQMIARQHHGEGDYENGRELDRPGPMEVSHRDLQRHHNRQVDQIEPLGCIGEVAPRGAEAGHEA